MISARPVFEYAWTVGSSDGRVNRGPPLVEVIDQNGLGEHLRRQNGHEKKAKDHCAGHFGIASTGHPSSVVHITLPFRVARVTMKKPCSRARRPSARSQFRPVRLGLPTRAHRPNVLYVNVVYRSANQTSKSRSDQRGIFSNLSPQSPHPQLAFS